MWTKSDAVTEPSRIEPATQAVCEEAGAELCNINAPGQLVIGGLKDAVAKACDLALARGAKRAIPLDVSGAFHTSLMQPAVSEFEAALAGTPFTEPRIPVVTNDTATVTTGVDALRAELAYQLTFFAAKVQGTGGSLDGNGNGTGGDNFTTPTTGPGRIHRLFGDADGDGDVDAVDYGTFRGAFGGTSNLAFDFDGDGDVDAVDFGQFRSRFGSSV